MRKQITMHCGVQSWSVPGWTAGASTVDFSHDCDTEGGSSGAPVFNTSGQIVGLHHYGHAVDPATCRDTDSVNKAVRIDQIIDYLTRNRANNGNVVDKLSIVH
jgi:V8-like Glu-specific endopeptidase